MLWVALSTLGMLSTSKAQEGLYVYDAVQRLYDSRFGDKNVSDIRQYIRFGALGATFTGTSHSVVLIDEIDKADVEFPNDLLHELDKMSFRVHETGDEHKAHQHARHHYKQQRKGTPDAFLRRCIFHFISFPDRELMAQIVDVHHPNVRATLIEEAISRFYFVPKSRRHAQTAFNKRIDRLDRRLG